MPRTIRAAVIEGNTARIPLTRGFWATVDLVDLEKVSAWSWRVTPSGAGFYASRKARVGGKQVSIYMHRQIFGHVEHGFDVDHIDGDRLNNRRANLRAATRSQNMHNTGVSKRNRSGFKGVSWDSRRRCWLACVNSNKVPHRLGCFDTPEEAHAAYVSATIRLHGEFARTS